MNEIIIKKQDFSHIIKKQDIWIVYLNNGKYWICEIGGLIYDDEFITLKLATKGKCDR